MKEIRYNGITVNINEETLKEISEYLEQHEIETVYHGVFLSDAAPSVGAGSFSAPKACAPSSSIADILRHPEDTFQAHLLNLIDKKGLTDAEVYKKADIDRRHFSKIRKNPDYRPKKSTAIALAIALELNIDEAADLLRRAGYAFSPSSRADLIARYCIEHGIYDLIKVNAILYSYDQPLLGGQTL